MPDPTLPLLAAPVVDIDGTLFVQAAIFVSMCLVLQALLFRPWLKVKDLRTERIDHALARSVDALAEARELELRYGGKVKAAREQAMGTRSEQRVAAELQEAEVVGKARDEAAAQLAAERSKLDAAATEARKGLESHVDALASDAVAKILGRTA